MPKLSKKHRKTLAAIYQRPTLATVRIGEVIALIEALGGEVDRSRDGSRVHFDTPHAETGLRKADSFHEPHPGSEMKKYAVEAVRVHLAKQGHRP
jgi:hypothetical protein